MQEEDVYGNESLTLQSGTRDIQILIKRIPQNKKIKRWREKKYKATRAPPNVR